MLLAPALHNAPSILALAPNQASSERASATAHVLSQIRQLVNASSLLQKDSSAAQTATAALLDSTVILIARIPVSFLREDEQSATNVFAQTNCFLAQDVLNVAPFLLSTGSFAVDAEVATLKQQPCASANQIITEHSVKHFVLSLRPASNNSDSLLKQRSAIQ